MIIGLLLSTFFDIFVAHLVMVWFFITIPLFLHVFFDANQASDKDDFTSTSAYIVYIGSNPILWSFKKQRVFAHFSSEAEYLLVACTFVELCGVCSLLIELGVCVPQIPMICYDNVSTTHLYSNMVFHSHMKHVALD